MADVHEFHQYWFCPTHSKMYVTIDIKGDDNEYLTEHLNDVLREKEPLCVEGGCGKWGTGSREYSKDGDLIHEDRFGGHLNLGDRDNAVEIVGFCHRALNIKGRR